MKTLILDLETAPNWPLIRARWPCPPVPEFDPAAVKTGNLKDEAKIADKVIQAGRKHDREMDHWEEDHWAGILSSKKCLLNPALSVVCATGMIGDGSERLMIDHGEGAQLEILRNAIEEAELVVGWNIKWDLWVIDFRCRCLGIDPPVGLRGTGRNARYWHDCVIDLMEDVACHQYGNRISLKVAAPALGFRQCPDPDGGKHFWEEQDRVRQEIYLRWDILAVEHIFRIYYPHHHQPEPKETHEKQHAST